MTIDERLERLTGRHEALTQTVELMAAENRERDRMWDEKMGQWDKQMSQVMESIARRLHIAEIPEHAGRKLILEHHAPDIKENTALTRFSPLPIQAADRSAQGRSRVVEGPTG